LQFCYSNRLICPFMQGYQPDFNCLGSIVISTPFLGLLCISKAYTN
jgi:hypothetical protein